MLTLIIASVGFITWYFLSTSLRLAVRYQIMYDANPPYVYRILRRRILGMFIYALIPLFIIYCTRLLGKPSLHNLQISFHWDREVGIYTFAGIVIVTLISLFTTPKHASLEQYPEVRVRFWRPNILWMSALSWIGYTAALEFFYRGLLYQSLRMNLQNEVTAIVACTALYALSHYFRLNRITFTSIIYGAIACYVVLKTGSLIPTMVSHICLSLFVEWLSIRHHKEMFVLRT